MKKLLLAVLTLGLFTNYTFAQKSKSLFPTTDQHKLGMVSYTYRIAFTDAGANFGLAAAISTVIFFLVAILSLLNLKMTQSNDQRKG